MGVTAANRTPNSRSLTAAVGTVIIALGCWQPNPATAQLDRTHDHGRFLDYAGLWVTDAGACSAFPTTLAIVEESIDLFIARFVTASVLMIDPQIIAHDGTATSVLGWQVNGDLIDVTTLAGSQGDQEMIQLIMSSDPERLTAAFPSRGIALHLERCVRG